MLAPRTQLGEKTIYLLRHAIPEGASSGRYLGQNDPPLSEKGRAMAIQVASDLRDAGIQAIYSSSLRRASETAAVVSSALMLSVTIEPDIKEINFGAFEGLTFNEVATQYPEEVKIWQEDPEKLSFPGGESFDQMYKRVSSAADRIFASAANTILVVSHGGALRLLLQKWLSVPQKYLWSINIGYAGLIVLRFTADQPLGEMIALTQSPKID